MQIYANELLKSQNRLQIDQTFTGYESIDRNL